MGQRAPRVDYALFVAEIAQTKDIASLLSEAATIAVLGIHDDLSRAAGYVPEYLAAQGYRIIGVNPTKPGLTLYGEAVRATLAEIAEPVDIVDVFRRSVDLPRHVADILAMSPRPRAVWFQLGIVNDEVARLLRGEEIDVVQDRCTLADHRRMGIGRR